MIWHILLLAFGKNEANPVENINSEVDQLDANGSYLASVFTTLIQAVLVSSMSVVLLYGMFSLKSRFNSNRTEQRLEQRLYKQCGADIDGGVGIGAFSERRRIVDLESVPVWQVPKVKSHRTNHWAKLASAVNRFHFFHFDPLYPRDPLTRSPMRLTTPTQSSHMLPFVLWPDQTRLMEIVTTLMTRQKYWCLVFPGYMYLTSRKLPYLLSLAKFMRYKLYHIINTRLSSILDLNLLDSM